jgi:hypothetical protein
MRIYESSVAARAAAPKTARRAASGTFSLSAPEDAGRSGASAPLRAVASLDALIALQGVEDPTERRRRVVARGRKALDALDALKLRLLDGTVDRATLSRLRLAGEGLTETTGDVLLDAVMREIDLRVAVELAKLGPD